jgi:hypothetical protein
VVGDDPVFGFRQIFMCIEAGVEKGDGHATSGKSVIRIHPQGSWQYVIGLFKNEIVGINLGLGPAEKLYAVWANLRQLSRRSSVSSQKRSYLRREIIQRSSVRIYAPAKVAT